MFFLSIRFKEINHAIFFICEMNSRNFKITRVLVKEFLKNDYIKIIFQKELIENQK